jgi:hypothetical protein
VSKPKDGHLLAILCGMAVVVGVVWTLVTGQVRHWLFIAGGVAVALGAAKAANSGRG